MKTELSDLQTAERVLASFDLEVAANNANRVTAGSANGYKPETAIGRAFQEAAQPTMPDMIIRVLADALRETPPHKTLENREIAARIRETFGIEVNEDYVSSTIWRVWKRGKVRKIKQGVYALPKETPTSEGSGENTLAGANGNQQGGEARLGGGT